MSVPSVKNRLLELSLALGVFSIATSEFAAMSLLPQFTTAYGVSVPVGGRAVSAYAIGVVVGAPVLAILGAMLPRRSFLVAMIGLFAAANLGSAFAPSFDAFVLMRFLCGLPHGAYFGVACLVAATMAPPHARAQATARVMLGFTSGTIVGVPLVNVFGRSIGWHWAFLFAGILAAAAALAIWVIAPRERPSSASADWRRELGALRSRQVWLMLGVGAIGQGGLFSVFSYLASALESTQAPPGALSTALVLFGIGMAGGVVVNGRLSDRFGAMKAILWCLLWAVFAMSIYALAVGNVMAMLIGVLLVGCSTGLATSVQTRLMDVAGESQVMAAALNHAAFNVANAIGPIAGGLALSAGFGWSSTGWVGAGLAICGLGVAAWAQADFRRTLRPL